jgi:hypothetical protein
MQFNGNEKYILENDVVQLRPLETTDYDYLLPFALNEPELWIYSLTSAAGTQSLKTYIEQAFQEEIQRKSIHL